MHLTTLQVRFFQIQSKNICGKVIERKGPSQPRQRGGSGTGFRVPPHVLFDEADKLDSIFMQLHEHIQSNKYHSTIMTGKTSIQESRNLSTRKEQLCNVKKAIKWRMFILQQRGNQFVNAMPLSTLQKDVCHEKTSKGTMLAGNRDVCEAVPANMTTVESNAKRSID